MALHTGTVGPIIRANNTEPEAIRQVHQSLIAAPGIVNVGDFAVTQTGTPSRAVSVGSGFAFVPGTNSSPAQGGYHVYNDAAVTVSITAADPTNPRIDLICVTVPDAYYTGASNTPILQAIAGTPAGSPSVPALPANSLALAQVAVAANATTIVNANITVPALVVQTRSRTRTIIGVGNAATGFAPGQTNTMSLAIPAQGYPYEIMASGTVEIVQSVAGDQWQVGVGNLSATMTSCPNTSVQAGVAVWTAQIPPARFVVNPDSNTTLYMVIQRVSGTGTAQVFNVASVHNITARIFPL